MIGKPRTLKWLNRKILLDFLRESDEITIAEISDRIGLSKPTVKKSLDHYIEKGLVIALGKGDSTEEGGKKPELFQFNACAGYVIAIHVFPDELYAAIFDLKLQLLARKSLRDTSNEDIEHITNDMCELVTALLQMQNIELSELIGIAVGSHGVTNYDEGIVYTSPHFPSWGEDVHLKEILLEKLPANIPLYIDNQIRFQVFAEQAIGVARGKQNIVVIEGGVGLVAGIIVKNEIKRGVHYLAGEIGHMIINPQGDDQCKCGGNGCFEVMVTVKRILKAAQEKRRDYPNSQIFADSDTPEINNIFDASNAGDPLACALIDDVSYWFAIGLCNLILMHDPEIIVFQGTYADAGEYSLKKIQEGIGQCSLLKLRKNVEFAFSSLGKDRGILGGAAYVISQYFADDALYET